MNDNVSIRQPSLSLVTVASLFEEKDRINPDGVTERRSTLAQIHVPLENLSEFYSNETIETMKEAILKPPSIIIDLHDDEKNQQTFVENENRTNNQIIKIHEISSTIDPPHKREEVKNKETAIVKYLKPPSFRTNHRYASESSLYSKSKERTKDSDDNISIGKCSIGHFSQSNNSFDNDEQNSIRLCLVKFLSVVYALFLVTIGSMICISDLQNKVNNYDHLFIIITTAIGFLWVAFLHWDIQRYKRFAIEYLKPSDNKFDNNIPKDNSSSNSNSNSNLNSSLQNDYDTISITTEYIFNNYDKPNSNQNRNSSTITHFEFAYKFLQGKHSGNFYLKCGMTIFCFGSILHHGIAIAQQIFFFSKHDSGQCKNVYSLLVHFARCSFSFYQLFIFFKYSNILINRFKTIARFALMHLVGSSISYWFSVIIEEAIEDYVTKVHAESSKEVTSEIYFKKAVEHRISCSGNSHFNGTMETLPYLYPFTIEYNIILASAWFIIWANIGKHHLNSHPHHIRSEIKEDEDGRSEVVYKSGVSINVDCHASNRGLFGGLFILLLILITIVVFFSTIKLKDFSHIGVHIYTGQIALLTIVCLAIIPLAYRQTRQLHVVNIHHFSNSFTKMDDVLVLIPLPFYLLHYSLAIKAESAKISHHFDFERFFLIFIYICSILQVVIQSPFIVDGIRRCSNSKELRFRKPGRELITFLLILNISLWILNTFELKSVDKHQSPQEYFGKFNWMIISHTTLPLMLLYRFHSSVCLSDIWKSAYEKDEGIH